MHLRFIWLLCCAAAAANAAESLPVAQQDALVQKYCAVCHTEAAKQGGLSLQHFDAAEVPPSLAAMLLSKLSGGASLQTVLDAATHPSASALLSKSMKTGALGAAGIPYPDKPTLDAWVQSLAAHSVNASEWFIHAGTASILRELPQNLTGTEARAYRLIVSCNAETHVGEIQLAWAPTAQIGPLIATFDAGAPVTYQADGSALTLGASLPKQSLRISGLFPGETVWFPFAKLREQDAGQLSSCFENAKASGF